MHKPNFIHKFSIAQKEADETLYWLELLKESEYISVKEFESIYSEAESLLKIIKAIIISAKINPKAK